LAQIYLTSLNDKYTLKAIRNTLKRFKKQGQGLGEDKKLEALAQAYEETMNRINGQNSGSRQLAQNVLSWITCAKRPLSASELQHALAAEVDELGLDEENLTRIEDIVSVCAGLVTVDEESNIIRLVHYTTQEYLERTRGKWFPNAETDITAICVTYLSFRVFENGFCQTDADFEERLRLNPLYDYAAHNWGYHARAASAEVEQLVVNLLKSEAKVSSCSQAMMASRSYSGHSQMVPKQVTRVHLAAYFGLGEVMVVLLKGRYDLDSKDSYGRTPLSYAAEKGHEAVMKLLVEKGAELETKSDYYGRTPLSYAAEDGHAAVVKLLLEKGAELETKSTSSGRTPLSYAAEKGHEAVVKLLVEKGAEPETKDENYGRTPLLYAVENGHVAVVKLLVEKGAELETKSTSSGQTPLSYAARYGHEAVVKLLLEKGAELETKDNNGQTPLLWAARNGHEAVVKLLVEKGAELETKDDYYGQTPLLYAAGNGHEAVVKLLLEKGAELETKSTSSGQTPLSYTARKGHEAVVKLLLEKGAELETKDKYSGQTPLSWAARNGHEAVGKLLLEKGAQN
jgi:ankyrin repeat protein